MNVLEKLRLQPSLLFKVQSDLKVKAQTKATHVASASALLHTGVTLHVPTAPIAVQFRPKPLALHELIAQSQRRRDPYVYQEIDRICAMPISHPLTEEQFETYCAANILVPAYRDGFRFLNAQASALYFYDTLGVLFCPIGAGGGKTLVDVGVASRAYAKGIKKILLLIPSHVYKQFVTNSLPWIRSKIPVRVPFIFLGNTTASKRLSLAKSGRPGCYVLPYSCLSTADSEEVLHAIAPELIIADEAHRVAQRRAARSQRLTTYINKSEKADKAVWVVPQSGTITNKTVMEYHHLALWALRDMCPLPKSPQMASDWGQYIDAKAEYTGTNAGPIAALVDWAKEHFPDKEITNDIEGFRAAYRLRLTSTPGVVATSDSEVACSLYIANIPVVFDPVNPAWLHLEKLMKDVIDNFITPNGDQIEHAIHSYKWLYELSSGFYNEQVWPEAAVYAKRKSIPLETAAEHLQIAQDHHDLQQLYAKELRKWLSSHHIAGIDTPMLVGNDMRLHGAANVGEKVYAAWQDMKALEFDGMPVRDSNAIRVYDYKVMAAVEWARTLKKGGIIWAYSIEMVLWIYEYLQELGMNPLLCNAGSKQNSAMTDPKNAHRIMVASIMAHGEGTDGLQANIVDQYFVQFPRVARTAEQVLARLHRIGQTADEIVAITNHTTLFDKLNFAACLNDALYIQQTTSNRQRVIYAGYDPLPDIFSPAFLRERGMENKMLTAEHQKVLADLFGTPSETETVTKGI